MSYKVKYKDGTEEVLNKAKEFEEDGCGFFRFDNEEEETICWISSDIIAKIE